MRRILPLILCGLCAIPLQAQTDPEPIATDTAPVPVRLYHISSDTDLAVSKPYLWGQLKGSPHDYWSFLKSGFSKDNLPVLAAVTGSTVILMKNDQRIYRNTVRQGRSLHLAQEDKTKTFLKAWGLPLFRGPTDMSSAIYFLGDGWVTVGLISSFEIVGSVRDDWRAIKTAHDIMEGMLLAGFTTQTLKRITGRETPSEAGMPGGTWRFFPGAKDYFAHQSRYDAFPSGHEANAMMTVTILAENYADVKFIRPVGYSLMALLGFQMVNNGVHWASDYPLALAIGYSVGKTVSMNGKTRITRTASGKPENHASLKLYPSVLYDGSFAPVVAYSF